MCDDDCDCNGSGGIGGDDVFRSRTKAASTASHEIKHGRAKKKKRENENNENELDEKVNGNLMAFLVYGLKKKEKK